jgi:hypothetical protein
MDEILGRMKQDARLVSPLTRRIREYERLAASGEGNAHLLEKALQRVRKVLDGLSPSETHQSLEDWYGRQAERIRQMKDEFRYRFGNDLKAALAQQGLELQGQFPKLRAGLYSISVDFEAGYAGVFWGPEIERIRTRAALSVSEIARLVASFDARLRKAEFKPDAFLRALSEGYDRRLSELQLASGSRVYLVELLSFVAFARQPKKFAVNPSRENFQEYSRIHFGFDLYRLKQSGNLLLGDRRMQLAVATFDSTTEKSKSIWIPDNEQGAGTYYSYLSFAPIEREG